MSLVSETNVKHVPKMRPKPFDTVNNKIAVKMYSEATAIVYPNGFFVSNGNLRILKILCEKQISNLIFNIYYIHVQFTTYEMAS